MYHWDLALGVRTREHPLLNAYIPVRASALVCHRNNTPAVVFGGTFQVIFVTERCAPVRLSPRACSSRVSSLHLEEKLVDRKR